MNFKNLIITSIIMLSCIFIMNIFVNSIVIVAFCPVLVAIIKTSKKEKIKY